MIWAIDSRQKCATLLAALMCFAVPGSRAQQPAVQATTVATPSPSAVAFDSSGNLYIALQNDHVVQKVDVYGLITTIAGNGTQGFGGDGGSATSALLDSPEGVAVDSSGRVYIADTHNHRIRSVSGGIITTVAGTGVAGFSGDGGSATAAQLNLPTAISVDSTGTLLIADTNNHRIRKVASGVISTVAGTGEQGFAGDTQAATAARLDSPRGVAADPSQAGVFYFADTRNQRLRKVDASGIISTVAGNGAADFSGDGGAATAAALNQLHGITVDATGKIYLADTNNQRVRLVSGATISTVAGSGSQGFGGDLGAATSAVLDSPNATAINGSGVLEFADRRNQRVRSVSSETINTVAGAPPASTEGLLLAGPVSGTYGSSIGSLTVRFTNGDNQASGQAVLNVNGIPFTSSQFSNNTATFDLSSLSGGLQSLAASYAGDASNAPIASGVFLVNVAAAAQTLTFAPLTTPVSYPTVTSAALNATSSTGLPVTFSATGPATVSGSTLSYTGAGTVVVTATQAGNANYAAVTSSQTVQVNAATITASSISPSSATLGVASLPVTITGSGFTSTAVVRLNGAAQPSTVVSSSVIRAVLPQLLAVGSVNLTVYDPVSQQESAPVVLTVAASSADATLSTPGTNTSAQQTSVGLKLGTVYPVPISGVLTLSFTPNGSLAVDDPAIQFSTGGRSYAFTIPANSTTVPSVAFQTGTVAGTITVTLSLTAQGVDVTPSAARTATVVVGRQVPSATVSFTQTGPTLTVTVVGFSNDRTMSQAVFNFAAAPGTTLASPSVTVPVSDIFASWFGSSASNAYGSQFSYTQTFNLSDAGAKVQSISVTLTNSVGASAQETSQ